VPYGVRHIEAERTVHEHYCTVLYTTLLHLPSKNRGLGICLGTQTPGGEGEQEGKMVEEKQRGRVRVRKTKQNKTKQNKTKQNKTKQHNTIEHNTEQCIAKQNKTAQLSTIP
jgi:hypothetical protein